MEDPDSKRKAARLRAEALSLRQEQWERDFRRLYEYLSQRLLAVRTAQERSAEELGARLAELERLPSDEAGLQEFEAELLSKEREQAARHASEIDRMRSRFREAADQTDPEIERLRNDIEVVMRELSRRKKDAKDLLAEAGIRRLEALFEEKKDELHRRQAAAARTRDELKLREEHWPARLKRTADQGYRRLASARRRRERTAARYRLRLEALRKEALRAKETVEDLRAKRKAEGNRPPEIEKVGELEAARLSWVFGRQAHWEARHALSRQIAAVDAELRDAAIELAELARTAKAREEDNETEHRRITADFRKQCRDLRARFPLAPLRRQTQSLTRQLSRLRSAAEQFTEADVSPEKVLTAREAAKAALERRLRDFEERWTKEKADLEAQLLLKRRELKKKRTKVLEAEEARTRRVAELEEARNRSSADIASRLSRLRTVFAARCTELESLTGTLRAQAAKAREVQEEASRRLQQERVALDERLQEMKAACGGLQGSIAARGEEAGRLRTALQASINEIEGKLLEAEFDAERITGEERALSREHAAQLSKLEATRARFEQLADEFLVQCGASAPFWDQWKTLGSRAIGRLSEVYRQEILSRAGELHAWSQKIKDLDTSLKASRDALNRTVAAHARESGLRAFREGDIDSARERLRRCVSLGPDAEAERILRLIGPGPSPEDPAGTEEALGDELPDGKE